MITLTDEIKNEVFEKNEFVINDDAKAEWALCKIKELKNEKERKRTIALQMIEYYQKAIEKIDNDFDCESSFLTGCLYAYMKMVTPQETKTGNKQYKLLSGKLRIIKSKPEILIEQNDMLEWAQTNAPAIIKIVKRVNKTDFQSVTSIMDGQVINKETGEVIESAKVIDKPEEFKVEV